MKEVILSIIAGVVVGALFKLIKLPVPAPPVFSAVIGIFGLYLGGKIMEIILGWFGK